MHNQKDDRYHILLIDDNRWMLSLFGAAIGARGHKVTKTQEPEHAIQIYRAAKRVDGDRLDGILTDFHLGSATGVDLIGSLNPEVPVVLMSVCPDVVERQHRGIVAARLKTPYNLVIDTLLHAMYKAQHPDYVNAPH